MWRKLKKSFEKGKKFNINALTFSTIPKYEDVVKNVAIKSFESTLVVSKL